MDERPVTVSKKDSYHIQADKTGEIASWIARCTFEDIPERIVWKAKLQMMSVLGAIFAGAGSEVGKKVITVTREMGGRKESTLLPFGEKLSAENVSYTLASLSLLLDYDDYLYPVHTGHSAVVTSLAMGEATGKSGREIIAAQVVANEVEGRLGGAIMLGPFNGQMCSFVHLAGSAAVASRFLGLDERGCADSLRIAFYQTNHGLYGGFMGSEAKALTASGAVWSGITASRMAAAGMRGVGDIIGGRGGFVEEFSFVPLMYMLSGYGKTWLTDTICYKIYPGCAYIDSAVDCAIKIAREKDVDPDSIESIDVYGSLLTTKMNDLAAPFVNGPETPKTTLNFTIPFNVAASIIDRELTPRQFTSERVSDPKIWELASKVRLRHDPALTLQLRKASQPFLNAAYLKRQSSMRIVKFVRHHLDMSEIKSLFFPFANLRMLTRSFKDLPAGKGPWDLAEVDLSSYKMSFGARVEVIVGGGTKMYSCESDVPIAAAGHPADDTHAKVREKFLKEAVPLIGEERASQALGMIETFENLSTGEVTKLIETLCVKKEKRMKGRPKKSPLE